MPNWRKVIVSGSDATLTSVTASAGLIVTGSARITGSLDVMGSLVVKQNATTGSLDTRDRILYDDRNRKTFDWNNRLLYDTQVPLVQSADWNNRVLYSNNGEYSVNWDSRYLYNSTGDVSVDWENKALTNNLGNPTLDWNVETNGYAISSSYYYKSKIDLDGQQKFIDTPILSNTANYAGEVIIGAVDATVTIYDLVYLKTDGVWYPVVHPADYNKLLGICLEVPPVQDPMPIPYVPGPGSILLEGTVTILSGSAYHNESPIVDNLDHGLPIYPKGGDGKFMTTTSPTSSGEYVRVLGHAYQQSTVYPDYWVMKFRPSNDWIQI